MLCCWEFAVRDSTHASEDQSWFWKVLKLCHACGQLLQLCLNTPPDILLGGFN